MAVYTIKTNSNGTHNMWEIINISRTSNTAHFPSVSNISNYGAYPDLDTMEVTIKVYNASEIQSVEDIEDLLTGSKYPWLTDEMMEEAIREKYPEHFL